MNDTAGPSGRFVLRIDPELHAVLRRSAASAGLSLNEYCATRLASRHPVDAGPADEVLRRATTLFGDNLVGLVVFGSWARDELAEGSDVDLLVVLGGEIGIRRELYERWDNEPLTWSGRSIEPHFAHLPDPAGSVSGFWAEIAVDGIILVERNYEISRSLASVRRRIAAGEIVRRWVHGHPYWTEAA